MDLILGLEPKLAFGFWLATLGIIHVLVAPYATYVVMKQGESEEVVVKRLYIIWMIPLLGSIILGVYALFRKRPPRDGLVPAEDTGIDWGSAAEEMKENLDSDESREG